MKEVYATLWSFRKTASSYLICLLKRREEGLGAGRGGTDVTRV
jgi:hypothetical protein